jgi:hypothetical protein
VGGSPPQTQKPRSQGAWPLNPAEVHGVKLARAPGRAWASHGRGRGPGLAMAVGKAWASHGRGRGSKCFTFPIFNVFSVFHTFCILVFVFHIVHMYFFETWFSWALSLFLCSNLRFGDFVEIGSIDYFFFDMYFFRLSFIDFLFKIPFVMHNI